MSKEIDRLNKARNQIRKVAAVTTEPKILANLDSTLAYLGKALLQLNKSEAAEGRADYLDTLNEIMAVAPSPHAASVLDQIMLNIERGVWEVPKVNELIEE